MARFAITLCFVVACARGGQANGNDAPQHNDAPISHPDGPAIDAPLADSSLADTTADGPDNLFCSSNPECTNSGECCISFGGPGVCGPGVVVFGICVPQ